jgi:hypothetical protein
MEQKPHPEAVELALYGTLTSHLSRALKMIGLKRQLRDVTPTLQTYLDAVRQPEASEDDQDPFDN